MMNTQTIDRAATTTATAAPSPARVHTCSVSHFPRAVGAVRRHAQDVLADWGMPRAAAEEALLVISDLVTNAIVHGMPPVELRLSLQREGVRTVLRVEVTDAEAAPAPVWPGSAPLPGARGCGSAIVQALALRYGTDSRSGTITWWADLPAF